MLSRHARCVPASRDGRARSWAMGQACSKRSESSAGERLSGRGRKDHSETADGRGCTHRRQRWTSRWPLLRSLVMRPASSVLQGHAAVGQNDIGAAGGAEVGAYAPSSARTTLMTSSTTSDTRYAPEGPRASRLAPAEERRVPGWYATVRDAVAPVSGAPRRWKSVSAGRRLPPIQGGKRR